MSIEFSIWVPFIVFLLVIVTDTSFLYLSQNQMWAVARDTARRMTTNVLPSTDAAETWAESVLSKYDLDYTVTASKESDYVMVVVTTPVAGVAPFGLFSGTLLGESVVARVVMRRN